MNTHESYVSLETAKMLKEAGFDWECSSLYTSDGEFNHLLYNTIDWDYGKVDWNNVTCKKTSYIGIKGWEGGYSAPTLDVAQRWLREVKGIYIGIVALENKHAVTNSDGWTFHYEYGKPTFDCDIQNERCENISTLDVSFDIYEEAQESGIKKALEIILEERE